MSRKMSAMEVKITLANLAKMPPDDVDGYLVVYVKGNDVIAVLSNADDERTIIGTLARAIEQRAVALTAQ